MNKHYNVPWTAVRNVVHLEYDYLCDEASQFDFISEIPDSELQELKEYATLQRHYDKEYEHGPCEWSDIIKLICIEQDWRINNNHML